MKKIISMFAAMVLSMSAMAQVQTLKVATGPVGKGYSAIFKDMKSVCGDKVNLVEVNSSGGLENLSLLSTNKAAIGIAQLDTVMAMRNGDENIAGLQQVTPLNNNILHVVSAANGYVVKGANVWNKDTVAYIRNFTQLRGKRVALVGSAQLLGRKLDKSLGYGMQFVDVNGKTADMDAIAMVKAGQVDAMMSVTSWPAPVFDSLTPANGVVMVNYDAPSALPFTVKSVTYRGIGMYNVQSLASRNILLTRPFKGANSKAVAALKKCLFDNLLDLQEGEFEPAWKEVKVGDQDLGVTIFK